ncbi:MAG: hypothetical protein RLZZ601_1251 [Pseudomonadota bacterium]|jgi:hypothetical protein
MYGTFTTHCSYANSFHAMRKHYKNIQKVVWAQIGPILGQFWAQTKNDSR